MEYTITKKRIKNFIIRVYPNKTIKISVPMRATSKEIENFINSKKDWLEKTLKKIEKRIEEKKELEEKQDKIIKFLGKEYKKNIIISTSDRINIEEDTINIFTVNNDNESINQILLNYKIKILGEILEEYIKKYSILLNTKISFYKIKNLKATWGIYHKKQNYISFNFDLIHRNKKF